ncbi:hypothetical protein NIES267_20490 [Calothrix parasitica NIES-267]|uniref:Uncharacterized protein n=1 Tax=Calothrix parasitica NIES-267 TaxID=1973488 RepID=A0A1Z4LMW3_9CYAN|nr:hypothetical protein NIES267_20490 [Calothrix parasitica NIES-267]
MTTIARNIEKIMLENGLSKVKIHQDNSECIVIQGNLDNTYALTFKNIDNKKYNDIKEHEHYVVLKNKENQRTITIWKQVNIQNFKSLIESAKIYAGINASGTIEIPNGLTINSDKTKKYHRSLIVPITLTIGVIICGTTGIFLGNTIRKICFQSEAGQVEIQENN